MPLVIDDSVAQHVTRVRDGALVWFIAEYEGKEKIKVTNSGSGNFDEFKASLAEERISFGFLRMISGVQESKRVKFVLYVFAGASANVMAKSRVSIHKPDVVKAFGQFHVEIFADGIGDVNEQDVRTKIKKSGGADYDQGSNAGGAGYQTSAGEIKAQAKGAYLSKEKETKIGPVVFEKSALPQTTPIDLKGRPMVAPPTEAMRNVNHTGNLDVDKFKGKVSVASAPAPAVSPPPPVSAPAPESAAQPADSALAAASAIAGAVAAAGAGFLLAFGSEGTGNGQFHSPFGLALDHEGNFVVSDFSNHRIQVLRYSDGQHLRTIGQQGAGIGQFSYPRGIALDRAGHLVVADSSNHRVQVLNYGDGSHVCTIGSKGSGDGQFRNPSGVAIDGDGNIVVYDGFGNGRIQVFRLSDGAHMRSFGSRGSGPGQLGGFGGVAFDAEGNLVVADGHNHRIQVLRYSDGQHLRTIGKYGGGNGEFRFPYGAALDGAGHLVVVEESNHRVQVLNYGDGSHVRTIGSQGSRNGQFLNPFGGFAIDGDGRIIMCDNGNHRVQVLQ